MKIQNVTSILAAFVILAIAGLGCGSIGDKTCGSGIKAQMLKRMLNAGDNKEYDRALVAHGSVTGDELPCVLDAINSWSATKRKNGALTLGLVGGDRKILLAAQKKVVLETSDLFVWAKVFDSLVSPGANANPADLAAKRHDMIAKALSDDDGFIQSVGLKAGVLGGYPGIEEELTKRLDSMDAKTLEVALDSLPPGTARKELPRLLKMLEDYETGTKYRHVDFKVYMFTSLLNALIRTENSGAYAAVRTALEKDYTNPGQVRGTREELNSFRSSAAVLEPDDSKNKFLYYLIDAKSIVKPTAIDILTTQVWAGKQEPDAKIVRICVDTIEKGNLNPVHSREHFKDKPEQISCERFFYFLETGENPMSAGTGKKRKIGSDALKFGREWLKKNE